MSVLVLRHRHINTSNGVTLKKKFVCSYLSATDKRALQATAKHYNMCLMGFIVEGLSYFLSTADIGEVLGEGRVAPKLKAGNRAVIGMLMPLGMHDEIRSLVADFNSEHLGLATEKHSVSSAIRALVQVAHDPDTALAIYSHAIAKLMP